MEEVFKITYKIKDEKIIQIFEPSFVKNNKNKIQMIIRNKIYPLKDTLEIENQNMKYLKIKLLILVKEGLNLSYMFNNLDSLNSFRSSPFNEKLYQSEFDDKKEQKISSEKKINKPIENYEDENNELSEEIEMETYEFTKDKDKNPSTLFYGTSYSIISYGISNITIIGVKSSSEEYHKMLSSLDPKRKNISVNNLNNIFNGCSSLKLISGIHNWNISYANDISYIFRNCRSLSILPDISNWNTKNINLMKGIFHGCSSLI